MTHQRQIICRRHSAWASAYDGNLLPCCRIRPGNLHLIRSDLIYRVFLNAPDIKRSIDQVPSAALLAWVLADHGARRRKRVIPSYQVDSFVIIALLYMGYISRYIHMRRT